MIKFATPPNLMSSDKMKEALADAILNMETIPTFSNHEKLFSDMYMMGASVDEIAIKFGRRVDEVLTILMDVQSKLGITRSPSASEDMLSEHDLQERIVNLLLNIKDEENLPELAVEIIKMVRKG